MAAHTMRFSPHVVSLSLSRNYSYGTGKVSTFDACMSYEEEDACMSSLWSYGTGKVSTFDACMSYEEEDACMSSLWSYGTGKVSTFDSDWPTPSRGKQHSVEVY
jgi:hypothetical protein